ncbi:MAG TPA: N-acetylmuramoyl-L-alanine amidase [Verrucomicrobiales bacterium]|nr:N-acetylmuramoyl-L-alanine amidase [Verrucomicrobiales bacterium]
MSWRRRGPVWMVLVMMIVGLATALGASTVVIDAGHGAYDHGAVSGGVMEKHLAFDTARRLERFLDKRGVRTVMTRDRDRFIPLSERVRVANRRSKALFVSIHYNSASNRSAQGLETYYYTPQSGLLAAYVHSHILYKVRPQNRGLKRNDFHVIRNCRHPSILVEGGFLSNYTERQKCLDPAYRQKIAEAIGEGILRYLGKG